MARPYELLAVFTGGALGAAARVGLNDGLGMGSTWPWATFAANIGGTILLGLVVTLLPLSTYRRRFLGTGFCGALTTFSTLQLEVLRLAHHGRGGLAVLYLAASVAGGLCGIVLVTKLARRMVAR